MTQKLTPMPNDTIFVFGSNERGYHGAGAAAYAYTSKGAKWGQGTGLAGHTYAIPTKDQKIQTLPVYFIERYIDGFLLFAERNPDMTFQVTQLGCGLAGLMPASIAPAFYDHPSNCLFDTAWEPWLPVGTKFWGTFP
jgi:hypothetical protein